MFTKNETTQAMNSIYNCLGIVPPADTVQTVILDCLSIIKDAARNVSIGETISLTSVIR